MLRCAFLIAVLAAPLLACAPSSGDVDFAQWDADLRAAGKLRSDRSPVDAPYTRDDLVRNFGKIGFGSEFEIIGGRYVPMGQDSGAPLTRWSGPMRYALFGTGDSRDENTVADVASRLSRASGLDIDRTDGEPNLLVFFLDDSGRQRVRDLFRTNPDYRPLSDLFNAWVDDPKWPCAAEFYYHPPDTPRAFEIYFAVVYIRDEVKGLSRRSCIEEEMAQTLGLARDDPSLRPSIFNDDEEFALMTEHDVALLRVLYDPRLRPGMTADQAMPLVRDIVESGGGRSGS